MRASLLTIAALAAAFSPSDSNVSEDNGEARRRCDVGPCPRPNTFLIGAPRCGTTMLTECLRQHPQVFFSNPKEVNYFNVDSPMSYRRQSHDGNLIESDDQYLALFRNAGADHRVIAEGSVWYLASRVALESILKFNPEARTIVMLRNPVDMAASLHAEEIASFNEDVTDFPTAWRLQEERARGLAIPRLCQAPSHLQYKEACALGTHLERAFAIFGRSRCHPILLDDFVADPIAVWADLLDFLGLEPDGRTDFPRINERRTHRFPMVSLALLVRPPYWLLRAATSVKRVLALRSLGVRPFVARFGVVPMESVPLDIEFRRRLVSEFLPEIEKLESILGRDLRQWRTVAFR